METRQLCELTSAADALDLKPLTDLASRALARLIEGKTPEQIRSTFHLPDDLTEEEKLEPIKNLGEDMRIRLLNRLYAKRRKVRTTCSAAAVPARVAWSCHGSHPHGTSVPGTIFDSTAHLLPVCNSNTWPPRCCACCSSTYRLLPLFDFLPSLYCLDLGFALACSHH